MGEVRHRWRPNEMFSVGLLTRLPAPQHRTEYVMAGDTKWRQRVYGSYPLTAAQEEPVTTYKPGEKLNRSWWKQVVRPGIREAIGDFEGQPNYRKRIHYNYGLQNLMMITRPVGGSTIWHRSNSIPLLSE